MDVRPLLARPPAPPAPNRRVWGAIGAIVLLQTATIAAVLAPRPETDARRRLLDEEMIEPPLLKVREDHDLGEADERRRLSGALWGLKTVTTATTLTKFMGTMVLCDTSSAAITVTLPAASDMAEQSGASHHPVWKIKKIRHSRAESSRRPPRHRCDACSMAWWCSFLTARVVACTRSTD